MSDFYQISAALVIARAHIVLVEFGGRDSNGEDYWIIRMTSGEDLNVHEWAAIPLLKYLNAKVVRE